MPCALIVTRNVTETNYGCEEDVPVPEAVEIDKRKGIEQVVNGEEEGKTEGVSERVEEVV